MSRSSKKQLSDLERLQQEIKDLKIINRSLMKELKKHNRPKVKYNSDELIQEEYDEKTKTDGCTHCGKGILREVELGPKRSILACSTCTFHRVIKKDLK